MTTAPATIEDYLSTLPDATRTIVESILAAVRAELPDAEQVITYQIPTFVQRGVKVLHVAGWNHHVALYPVPQGDAAFHDRIAPYVSGRGTLKFAHTTPVDLDLVREVARLRLAETT